MQFWEWLTESGHLFGQVSTKSPKQATVGQQVEWGVASHGVEGERVDSRWEAGHVTHLLFPVGSHGDGAHPGVCGRPLGEGSSSHYTWKSLEELKKVSFWSLSVCGDWTGNDGGFTEGRLASTLEESSDFLRERRKRNMLFLSNKSSTFNKDKCFWLAWTYEHIDTMSGLCQDSTDKIHLTSTLRPRFIKALGQRKDYPQFDCKKDA